jgi:Tol biopolymer transport system component
LRKFAIIAAVAAIGCVRPSASSNLHAEHRADEPTSITASNDFTRVGFVLRDTLWVARPADPDGRLVALGGGFRSQAQFSVPFQAWSPDGTRLLARFGSGGAGAAGLPAIFDAVHGGSPRLILPDSLAARLLTTPNVLTAPPQWSPDGRRIAFIARLLTGIAQVFVVRQREHRQAVYARLRGQVLVGVVSGWSPVRRRHRHTSSGDRDGAFL